MWGKLGGTKSYAGDIEDNLVGGLDDGLMVDGLPVVGC